MDAADVCTDMASLAKYLGLAPQRLFYLSNFSDRLYRTVEVYKKDNIQKRVLNIPQTELRGAQRIILEKILLKFSVSAFAYAYVPGRGAIKAAKEMVGPNHILRFDIKDFFPSITFPRVYGLFISLGFTKEASYLLSELTTYKGLLCQGAPTSPYLSNLICRSLDQRMRSLSKSWEVRYLRYSDDLFVCWCVYFNSKTMEDITQRILHENGFVLKSSKTRYFRKNSDRHVLGLLITNDTIKIPRKTLRVYRATFHKSAQNLNWARDRVDKLSGIAAYYKSVYGANDQYKEFDRIIRNVKEFKMHESYAV